MQPPPARQHARPDSTSDHTTRLVAAVAWAIGLAAVLVSVRSFLANSLNSDFAAFYESAAAWRLGGSPYVSDWRLNLNPPFMLWVFAPFTNWPLDVAARLWITVQLFALLLLIDLAAREVAPGSRQGALIRGVMLTVLAPTVVVAQLIREGQWVLWLAVLVTIAWRSARLGRILTAAALLGVLMAIKPFSWWFWLALPAPFRPRVLAAGAAGFVATVLASYLTGPDSFREWLALSGTLTTPHLTHWLNVSLPGHLTRSFEVPWMTGTALVTAALIPLLVKWRATNQRALQSEMSRWWLASLATVLASPLGWAYYVVLGVGPALAHLVARQRPSPLFIAGWIALLAIWVSNAPLVWATWIWTAGLICWLADGFTTKSAHIA